MSRAALLRRRAGAHRALLGLTALLVAGIAAAGTATAGVVRDGAAAVGDAARPSVVAGAGVAVGLLALAAVVTLAQAGTLLTRARATEVELLVSRGASPRQLVAAGTGEFAGVAVLAAAVGAGVAALVLGLLGRPAGPGTTLAAAAATAGLAVLVIGACTTVQALTTARRQVSDRSGRVRTVASGGLLVVALAAAGLCLVQLLRYGSPLVVTPAGARTDPLAAAAPALVLAVLALGAAGLLGGVARVAESVAERSPGLGVLTVRSVGRRLVAAATPLILLVLTGGTAALAGLHAGTSQALADDVARLAVGADLRVSTATRLPPLEDGSARGPAAEVAGWDGVAAALPVLRVDARSGDQRPVLLGLPSAGVDAVAARPHDGGPALGHALAGGLAPFAAAPGVPEGAEALAVRLLVASEVEADAAAADPGLLAGPDPDPGPPVPASADVTLWLANDDGRLDPHVLGSFGGPGSAPGAATATVALPAPLGAGWHLAAVDVRVTGGSVRSHLRVTVGGVDALAGGAATPLDLTGTWDTADLGAGTEPGYAASGLGLDAHPAAQDKRVVRVEPQRQGQEPLPAVVARPLAEGLGLAVGDPLELAVLDGTRLDARVAEVVEALPGALQPQAVAVDLGRLQAALLHARLQQVEPAEAWAALDPGAAAEPPAAVSEAFTLLTPRDAAAQADASPPVRTAEWVAAAGTAVLALAGVALAAVVQTRDRRGEVVALRAAGVGPRTQGRSRAAEVAVVAAVALVVGLAGGWALAALVVPGLARTSVVGVALVPHAPLALAAAPTALLVAALVAGVAATCALTARRVTAQARDTDYREEVR